jgi:hypothetical protein
VVKVEIVRDAKRSKIDVRRYSSEETREFYEQIEGASPPQEFAFLTGPPQ